MIRLYVIFPELIVLSVLFCNKLESSSNTKFPPVSTVIPLLTVKIALEFTVNKPPLATVREYISTLLFIAISGCATVVGITTQSVGPGTIFGVQFCGFDQLLFDDPFHTLPEGSFTVTDVAGDVHPAAFLVVTL
ncbi:hypothetical protein D3C85_765860 [compost metagenome]